MHLAADRAVIRAHPEIRMTSYQGPFRANFCRHQPCSESLRARSLFEELPTSLTWDHQLGTYFLVYSRLHQSDYRQNRYRQTEHQ